MVPQAGNVPAANASTIATITINLRKIERIAYSFAWL
jgi:hypothetical protein